MFILTGPLHSGKTTQLAAWCAARNDVGGVLSPVLSTTGRTFVDIRTGEQFPMTATPLDRAVVQIGRYAFASAAFAWAGERLRQATTNPGIRWLVVDEVGPLELRGEGLDSALRGLLPDLGPSLNVVLVVREAAVEAVAHHYGLAGRSLVPFPFPTPV